MSTVQQAQPESPAPSLNLVSDSIFANGLGQDVTGLFPTLLEDSDNLEDLVPAQQQHVSDVMLVAHQVVDQRMGEQLCGLNLAELQALKTQITLREKQLLTTRDRAELFAPLTSAQQHTPSQSSENSGSTTKLTLLEYTKIYEENTHFAEVVATRATADLIQLLRDPKTQFAIPGARGDKTPLKAAISYVASALRLTAAQVDRRVTAAAGIWPGMKYRKTKLQTPKLAVMLERGNIALNTASIAQEKLSDMRQAVRRAGGTASAADQLVQHQEREFVHHAISNNPHTFARFAKSRADFVTNKLIGPQRTLTNDQIKHEKGVFYDGQIGDCLHKLTVVVDDAELLQLTAIREFATKLNSETSKIRAQVHQPSDHDISENQPEPVQNAAASSRITPEDIDLGIAQLFDGQTRAERWLNTWLDFTCSGLILHKTYDPQATLEEQQRRNTALSKAAAHSETIADILGMSGSPENSKTSPDETLDQFIPPGYQILQPNLDIFVEITLQDLVGNTSLPISRLGQITGGESELSKIQAHLQNQQSGASTPLGSPGSVTIDFDLARQQACNQRIIPMVLGTESQPLDVGRAQRSFPQAIRRALYVRDRGCVVPGCPRPREWCQPHHLKDWAKGGPTSLENAVLLCRAHHDAVHKGLLKVHMEDDGLPSCSLPPEIDPTETRFRNTYWQT